MTATIVDHDRMLSRNTLRSFRAHAKDSPLWALPNTIITPQIATESVKLNEAVVDFWCENVRRFAENEPLLGVTDRQAGY